MIDDTELEYSSQRFRLSFTKEQPLTVRCPTCSVGLLELDADTFRFHECVESVCCHSVEDWEPGWIRYVFTGVMKCNNKRCSERVIVSGDGSVEPFGDYETGEEHWDDTFHPRFFAPAIDLFPIPQACPDEVSEAIRESFALAWQDFSSAGNKLRVAIEKLIDLLAPGATGTLHNKLETFRGTNAQSADMLMAVKWIGNAGSHTSDLRECDLAVAYQVMEKVLKNLYGNDQFLEQVVCKINTARNPIR